MSYTKKVLKAGNGTDYPNAGDTVSIAYTGNLYDQAQSSNHCRGTEYGSLPSCSNLRAKGNL